MEGTSRFVTWRNAIEVLNIFLEGFGSVLASTSDTTNTTELATAFQQFAFGENGESGFYGDYEADATKFNVSQYINALSSSGNITSEEAVSAIDGIALTIMNVILSYFKIKAPKKASKKASKPQDPSNKDPYVVLGNAISVYDTVMIYFFVAAGLTLIIMGLQIALAKKRKCAGDYAAIVLRLVVGLALALTALVTTNVNHQEHFLYSAWILPTVCLGTFIVVIVDGILGYVLPAPKELISAHEHHHHDDELAHHDDHA